MSSPTARILSAAGALIGARDGFCYRFFRAGGLDQVRIESADDLRHLGQLDRKLWVALSCPVKGLEFDQRTLALLDKDGDKRVRAPEVVDAVTWCCRMLKDPAAIFAGAGSLPLAAINDADPEGAAILAGARQILVNLGKPDAPALSVAEASDTTKIFAEATFNGDGVVKPGCAKDPAIRQVIEDIIAITGADTDRSGKPGINQTRSDGFFANLTAYLAWWDAGTQGGSVLPVGEATPAAFAAYVAVRAKIEDYLARCGLAAFDARAAAALNRPVEDYLAITAKDLGALGSEVELLPLQTIAAARSLDLTSGINPAWSARIAAFRAQVVEVLHPGCAQLDASTWLAIKAVFAPYEAWVMGKQGAVVESLGTPRLRAIHNLGAQAAINALITEDLAVKPRVDAIEAVERLVRYHRDLALLLRNFVNFGDFYDRVPPPPIFNCGTLFLDQRSFELCVRVDDIAAHGTLATLARVYIAYCTCTRTGGEKMVVAVGVTQGDSDYLIAGRNGMFIDRAGRDWDATITKIIDHPISIQQAFWAPYKKIGKMINDTIEKIAGDKDKAMMDKASASVTSSASQVTAGKPPVEKPKIDTGMLAAIGIATASLASAVGSIAASLFGLPPWKIPLIIVGVILAISLPAMIIAYMKLRQRTLGPLLEGNGWAINGRVKINIPLGNSLTALKTLPLNAERSFADPFEDKSASRRRRRVTWILVVTILAGGGWLWQSGRCAHWWSALTMNDTQRLEAELADLEAQLKTLGDTVNVRKAVLDKQATEVKAELEKQTSAPPTPAP